MSGPGASGGGRAGRRRQVFGAQKKARARGGGDVRVLARICFRSSVLIFRRGEIQLNSRALTVRRCTRVDERVLAIIPLVWRAIGILRRVTLSRCGQLCVLHDQRLLLAEL